MTRPTQLEKTAKRYRVAQGFGVVAPRMSAGWSPRLGFWAVASLIAFTATCSEPTATVCTREDVGSACSEPTTAERTEDGWRVVLRTTVHNRVEYQDGGNLCALTETRCIEEECNFFGVEEWSRERAISECRDQYER